jgi:uncharacterized metal-binding protein YceD (DUF177 family)
MKKSTASPLAWTHAVTDIPDRGLARERAMSEDERKLVSEVLGLIALSDAESNYRIERLAGGGFRLHGRLTAAVSQPCVVTLEPVESALAENFDVEFWPTLEQGDAGQDARILEGRDVEKLDGAEIPAGRIVFECLSAGIDPYPRKPDASFEWRDGAQSDPEKISPFAALSQLKSKR